MDFNKMIANSRKRLGAAPRSFGFWGYLMMKAWAPGWAWTDRINVIYKKQKTLLTQGRVVWAHIVQANTLLFEPGSDDCPALVVYGEDLSDHEYPVELLEMAGRALFRLKNTRPDDPELRDFADKITDEMDRSLKDALPRSMTEGHEVFMGSIMVPRKHLPNGRLSLPFFPLLIAPEYTDAALILPSKFWDPKFKALWLQS